MRAVIQCASSKTEGAGHLHTAAGEPVTFVARPDEAAALCPRGVFARPDDLAPGLGRSWRSLLIEANTSASNPHRLVQAARLYRHRAYASLVAGLGLERVFVLSAGWGLVGGAFRLPAYDITFSSSADHHKRRRHADAWQDFCHLEDTGEPIIFFGGQDYLPLFCRLTAGFTSPRTVFHRASAAPDAPGCTLVKYETPTRTNWHYECVGRFLEGSIQV